MEATCSASSMGYVLPPSFLSPLSDAVLYHCTLLSECLFHSVVIASQRRIPICFLDVMVGLFQSSRDSCTFDVCLDVMLLYWRLWVSPSLRQNPDLYEAKKELFTLLFSHFMPMGCNFAPRV